MGSKQIDGASSRGRRRIFSRISRRRKTRQRKDAKHLRKKLPSDITYEPSANSHCLLHFEDELDRSLSSASVPEVISLDDKITCEVGKENSLVSLIPTDVDSDSRSSSECSTSLSSQSFQNPIVSERTSASLPPQEIERKGTINEKIEKKTCVSVATQEIEKMITINKEVEKTTDILQQKARIDEDKCQSYMSSFLQFRICYLIIHTAIMLADGLQGTHLYVLYEGYGYSVASLYSLGFFSGAITSPFIGPIVDRIGRKKAAMIYCFLEIIINQMEQYPLFMGLILSRVIGGITTNLLFSVFESWLRTEHCKRGFESEKLEVIMRDSTIASNSAAIVSGYIAHSLASTFGAVGPFIGAVTFTGVALLLVGTLWSENFGSESSEVISFRSHMVGAYNKIVNDSKISRIGLIQGLTEGSLQTFVFLWSPALHSMSATALPSAMGLDTDGQPAYGLIFGAFMACGVVGSVIEPSVRNVVSLCWKKSREGNEKDTDHAAEVGILCAICYLCSAVLLLTPCLVEKESSYAFSITLGSFLTYEFIVGLYMPCEGVIRSIFMPNESICSLMTMLRVIVNVAVAVGVISTNFISFHTAFIALSVMMSTAACLQISLLPRKN